MKKGILGGLGLLFVVAILIGGCSKSEEKKAEAPPEMKQTIEQKATAVQEQAAEMKEEAIEKVEPAAESATETTATMKEQAVEAGKEMGQQALDSAVEKMPEEAKPVVDAVKSYSGGLPEKTGMPTGSEVKVPAVEAEAAPKVPGTSLEQTVKEKAVEEGIKLPTKY